MADPVTSTTPSPAAPGLTASDLQAFEARIMQLLADSIGKLQAGGGLGQLGAQPTAGMGQQTVTNMTPQVQGGFASVPSGMQGGMGGQQGGQPSFTPYPLQGTPPGVGNFAPSGTIFTGGSPFPVDTGPQDIHNILAAAPGIIEALQGANKKVQDAGGWGKLFGRDGGAK